MALRSAMVGSQGGTELARFDALDIHHLRLAPGRNVQQAIAGFLQNRAVIAAQPDYIREMVGRIAPVGPPPNDPLWLDGTLWGLQKIQAPAAWTGFTTGNGNVVIADVDTGVNYNHPDLAANMWHNPGEIAGNGLDDDLNGKVDDVYGIDTANNDSNPVDDNGHGTHTAGTIAGVGNNGVGVVGVNWNAKILACKFLNASGSGSDSAAVACFNYILALKQHGINIRVTSNSWGGLRGTGSPATALKNAIDALGTAGIVNVCAAGNNGVNTDTSPFDPASFTSSSIISVGASDQSDAKASFSNFGVTSVDLAAPGVSITSTHLSGYMSLSGTSMATPHVAGAAALLAAQDPSLPVDGIKAVLMTYADPVPGWSGNAASGGRLNVFSALNAVAGSPSVNFTGTDVQTRGDWPTAYGQDGRVIVGDSSTLPSYATVSSTGTSHTWTGSTSDVRALRRGSQSGRIAATWYASPSFDIDINITGSQSQALAIYCLDWDSAGRSQRIDVLNFATGAIIDTRTISNFSGGMYLLWSIRGHVILRVTRLAGTNAVVSGVFFGAALPNQPPSVNITSPANGSQVAPGQTIAIAASATDDGSVASVAFYADSQLLFTDTSSPYSYNWTTATNGPHTLTAIATDNTQLTTTSAPVSVSVSVAGGGNTATFASIDTTTQGSWLTHFGGQGYAIVGDATVLPAGTTLNSTGISYTWVPSTTDPRALQRASGSGRLAATWYQSPQFDLNLAFTDGQVHQVALYCLDWDAGGRSQRLNVYDAATNALLDTRTVTGFAGGQYVIWNIAGAVRINVTQLGGLNAIASAIFIGGAPSGNQPPSVSITSPTNGSQVAPGQAIGIAANATDDGSVASVAFYADNQLLFTDTSSPYSYNWTTAANGPHTLTAIATDNTQLTTTSAPVSVSVAAGTTATFTNIDTTTQGNWLTHYGGQGYAIVGDATSLPAGATLNSTGISYTWVPSTTDVRALQRASGNGRLAATWYQSPQFDLNLAFTDSQVHQVALYCLDWDAGGRSQRLDVYDSATNALLDTRTISGFVGGQYVTWNITGAVKIRVTQLGGFNAIASAVFIGPTAGPAPSSPPPTTPSTIALRADLIGTLGGGGNATSPIVAGAQLLLLNQTGTLYRWTGSAAQPILTVASAPAGLSPFGSESIINAAGNPAGTSVFVAFTSSTVPAGVPQFASPRPGADAWQVLYRYTFNGTALSNPQAIVALQVRSDGHTGGGMLALDTGPVLFATGDNGDAGEDGRPYAQDAANHLSKILRIDPTTGAVTVLASGVRNVQRLFLNPNNGDPRVEFADLGGAISEEINSVRLADLLASPIENFGWGRNAGDNRAREGTFYIDPAGAVTGTAPTPENGFTQPVAQFGREGAPLVGVTGTVSSTASFTNVSALFGDLPTGNVMGVTGVPGTANQTVYRVNLVDSSLAPVTLSGLAGGRPDPRFFLFPDGTAGVLLERTGSFYRLTQISQ